MTIFVVPTGGTIVALPYPDPENPPETATMPPEGVDFVRDALQEAPFNQFATRYHRFEMRDSSAIDLPYRNKLLQILMQAAEREILVTHGTNTVLDTADFFFNARTAGTSLRDKVILLTGAMTPLSNGPESDGYANLAFSLTQLAPNNKLTPGVYFVFCDYENPDTNSGAWRPSLYRYEPNTYFKDKGDDGRRYRFRRLPEARAGLS